MIRAIEFYLLESTGFAAAIGLLALSLRKQSAAARHTVLLVAAAKFAVPAAMFWLIGAGVHRLLPSGPLLPVVPTQLFTLLPAQNAALDAAKAHSGFWILFAVVWLAGAILALVRWFSRILAPMESSASALMPEQELLSRAQRRISYSRTVALRVSPSQTEPALSGVFRPTLTIPRSLPTRLTEAELESVFLHELAHAKRRDNLSAAFVHTLVCLLWFHPLLRWLEDRLRDERELACDEAVIACGAPPEIYVAGILKVCGIPLSAAVAGISRVSSSNLAKRMEGIMSYPTHTPDRHAPRWLLAVLVTALTIGPIALGFLTSAVRGQDKSASAVTKNVAQSPITCVHASKKYPEGTVIQEGNGPEQMCAGVLAPLDLNDPDHPRRVPQWIRTNPAIRSRSANVLHLGAPPPFSCKPKPSNSQNLCSCEGADLGFSQGSMVDSANGTLKCDKGNWRAVPPDQLGSVSNH